MEREPSSWDTLGGWAVRPGAKAQVTLGTPHIRYHHQEGTLKISKFGWLGAVVALAAVVGAVAYNPSSAQAQAGTATKSCTSAAGVGTSTCTLTVSLTALPVGPTTLTVTATGATFTVAPTAVVTAGGTCTVGPTALVGAPATSFTVVVTSTAVAPALGACTVTFTETVVGAGAVTQIVATGIAPALVPIAAATAVLGQLPVTIANSGCSLGATFGTAVSGGLFTPGTGAGAFVLGTSSITCRFTLSDAVTAAGVPVAVTGAVSSGLVSVTLQNTNLAGIITSVSSPGGGAPSSVGATTTVRCGVAGGAAALDNSCSTVDVTFTPTNALVAGQGLPFTLGVNVAYTPDLPSNVTSQATFTPLFTIGQGVSALNGPASISITCTTVSSLIGVNPTSLSSQFGLPSNLFSTQTPTAIGILPASIGCTAQPVDILGAPIAVAPGTIEVTSLSGTLLSLSGTLTSNLRIACGSNTVNVSTTVIALNNCTGVTFAVLGQGVGLVELRARYEPFSQSNLVGEAEGSTTVAFVAPAVGVSLALDPNPVAVGATGTATATLSTVFAISCTNVVLGAAGTLTSAAGQCINPTTGLAITTASNPGSSLNGIVVFRTDNTAIARFDEAGQATGGTTLGAGVSSTASEVVRDCGAFSGGGTFSPFTITNTTVGNLAPYFGGCTTVTARYRGVVAGTANIAAAFIPFLPGANSFVSSLTGTTSTALGAGLSNLNFFAPGVGPASTVRTLQVADVAPATTSTVNLARGCNNVSPTVSESVTAYLARVAPTAAVISIFQYNTATNSFAGAPGPSAPASAQAVADLTTVTRLTPVFVCVNAPAVLTQPAI